MREPEPEIGIKSYLNPSIVDFGVSPVISEILEAMRGKAEQDPRRARATARNQADRCDNAASRACSFEVSAEPAESSTASFAEWHIALKINTLIPFSRDR